MAAGLILGAPSIRADDVSSSLKQDQSSSRLEIPTGQAITPTVARGAIFQDLDPQNPAMPGMRVGQAVAVTASPDGHLLAVLTSGYNRFFRPQSDNESLPHSESAEFRSEYVFLFDITETKPTFLQALSIPESFQGLAWAPTSDRMFVSGGKDDTVTEFVRGSKAFEPGRTFALGHKSCLGVDNTDSQLAFLPRCQPVAGALAVSPDGTRVLITNLENDSVSLIDLTQGRVIAEQDLRPGIIDPRRHGESGGSYPRSVVWVSSGRAYVASERDREVIELKVSRSTIQVRRRMPVFGQPVALLTNRRGSRLYAALSTTGHVAVFATTRNRLLETVDATAPKSLYPNARELGGASSNALALSPDESTLLVSNGGENALAVIHLSDRAAGRDLGRERADKNKDEDEDEESERLSTVVGLVPTGWYPTGVATSKNGSTWYVVNAKSETGANGGEGCAKGSARSANGCLSKGQGGTTPLFTTNRFVMQLERAGLLSMPVPDGRELARLTRQVARNDHFDRSDMSDADRQLFQFLREHIEHVIYIIKENRSYDQVLGDLSVGNGDPRLALFPEKISPNHHALARSFVTLDNFLVSGEVSWSGWDWAVSAQTNDFRERQEPLTMADRGMAGEDTGFNRNINVGYATGAERHAARDFYPADPDILPSERDVTSPDGPHGQESSAHIWDAALRAGRTLRNWGFFGENAAYNASPDTLIRDPHAEGKRVFFATKSALAPYSDPYFLDFAPNFPDFWRVKEWLREFKEFSKAKPAPQLMLIRLSNDHFGGFAKAIDGVNTPETQMADNDYALGLIVEAVAQSPFGSNTLIISIEDDACAGPDHVDAHRSVALFAGAYVRPQAVVSKRYTTVSVVKTIEEILGLEPIGLNDSLAEPMSDVFDPALDPHWSYTALVPDVLRSTQLPLPPASNASYAVPSHSAAYWAKAMAAQDFSGPDRIDPVSFNHELWHGLKGSAPYPERIR